MIESTRRETYIFLTADQCQNKWQKSDWVFCFAILFIAIFTSGLHIRAYPTLSPIDELQHIDYSVRAGRFEIPGIGERVEQEVLAEAACRSVDAPGYVSPPCNTQLQNPDNFQERGFNTAASQFPTYYTLTGVVAKGVKLLTPINSTITSLRVTSGLWLGIALCILWYVMALINVPKRHRFNSFLLLISTPLVVLTSSTVTPDSMLFLAGSVLLISTIKYESEKLKWYYFLSIICIVFSIDRAVFLPVLAIFIYLFLRMFNVGEINYNRLWTVIAVPIVLYLMYFKVLPFIQTYLAPSPLSEAEIPMQGMNQITSVDSDRILQQLQTVVSPVWNVYIPKTLNSELIIVVKSLYNWLIIGSLLALSLKSDTRRGLALISGATLGVMVLAGPFYSFYYAYFSDTQYPAPGRFGLGLLPVAVVAVSTVMTKKSSYLMTAALSVYSYSYVVWLLL
jgi:hypothetical protein